MNNYVPAKKKNLLSSESKNFFTKTPNRKSLKEVRAKLCTISANRLVKKYKTNKVQTYLKNVVHRLIFNERYKIVARFKDFLILDDCCEFLKRYYTIKETREKIKIILKFHSKNLKMYPNYFKLSGSRYLFKNIYYQRNLFIQEQNKNSKKKPQSQFSHKYKHSAPENTIFTKSIQRSIVRHEHENIQKYNDSECSANSYGEPKASIPIPTENPNDSIPNFDYSFCKNYQGKDESLKSIKQILNSFDDFSLTPSITNFEQSSTTRISGKNSRLVNVKRKISLNNAVKNDYSYKLFFSDDKKPTTIKSSLAEKYTKNLRNLEKLKDKDKSSKVSEEKYNDIIPCENLNFQINGGIRKNLSSVFNSNVCVSTEPNTQNLNLDYLNEQIIKQIKSGRLTGEISNSQEKVIFKENNYLLDKNGQGSLHKLASSLDRTPIISATYYNNFNIINNFQSPPAEAKEIKTLNSNSNTSSNFYSKGVSKQVLKRTNTNQAIKTSSASAKKLSDLLNSAKSGKEVSKRNSSKNLYIDASSSKPSKLTSRNKYLVSSASTESLNNEEASPFINKKIQFTERRDDAKKLTSKIGAQNEIKVIEERCETDYNVAANKSDKLAKRLVKNNGPAYGSVELNSNKMFYYYDNVSAHFKRTSLNNLKEQLNAFSKESSIKKTSSGNLVPSSIANNAIFNSNSNANNQHQSSSTKTKIKLDMFSPNHLSSDKRFYVGEENKLLVSPNSKVKKVTTNILSGAKAKIDRLSLK